MKKISRYAALLPPAVIAAGIVAVLFSIGSYARYTFNIPLEDDIFTSLQFLINFEDAQSTSERIELLLRSRSSHIIAFSNLANLLDWTLFGTLNFRHLMLFGFAWLLVLTALLQTQFKTEDKTIHAVAVALLCVNCLTGVGGFQAINAMEYYPVLALTAGALLLLSKPGYMRLCFAALLISLATFSLGSGMFGFVAGAVVLLLRNDKTALFGWSICAIVMIATFFYLFGTMKTSRLASRLALDTEVLLVYFLTCLGALAQVIPVYGARLAPFVGFAFLAICVFLVYKKYPQKNPFITGMIVFILLTTAAITTGRAGKDPILTGPLSTRYAIHSCILLALFYVALVELSAQRLRRSHAALLCGLALLFNILAVQRFLPEIAMRYRLYNKAAQSYLAQGDLGNLVRSKSIESAQAVMVEAEKRNIYNMSAALNNAKRE